MVGETLTLDSLGTWTNTPTAYTKQWYQDAGGGSQFQIGGETGTTYVIQAGDIGLQIFCRVTATNANPVPGIADSNETDEVTSEWPSTLLYDGYTADTSDNNFGDSSSEVYFGTAYFTDASRRAIAKISVKLRKKAGTLVGKTFVCRVWHHLNDTGSPIDAIMATSQAVAGSDAWSATSVDFVFSPPFWTDAGNKYGLAVDMGGSDGSNYPAGYIIVASTIPGGASMWTSGFVQNFYFDVFQTQMRIYEATSPPAAPWTQHLETVNGQACRVLVPASPNGKGILVCHSAQQTEFFSYWSSAYPTTVALLEAGYTLFESLAHGDNWGNNDALGDYEDLVTLVRADYDVDEIVIWSTSMGGLAGMLLIAQGNVADILGWFGVSAVCDLDEMYAGFTASIDAAYASNYPAAAAGHDPILLSASLFDDMPMRFYASAADAVVVKADHADAMVTHLTGHADVSAVTVTGAHGAPANFDTSNILTFVAGCFAP